MELPPPSTIRTTCRLGLFCSALRDIIFPARCLGCGLHLPCWELPLLCPDCLSTVKFIGPPFCVRCGMPFESGRDHLCGRCLAAPYAFDLARSALQYRDPAASLISRLKFKGDLTGLSTLAALAGVSAGFRELSTPELIIPVPLHRERLKKRSFNQALLIARELFPDQGTKIEASLLVRNRPTTPQTGLSGRQRRKNLFRAFSVKRPQMTTGKKILLVDDVFTTGSTVHECARTLSRSGAASVEVFTLARAV